MNSLLKRGFLYRAIWLELLIILVAYIVPIGGLVVGVYDFPWRLANQIGLGLLFGGWLFWKIKTGRGPVKTSLDWLIGGWLVLTLVTTLSSLDRRMSWEMVAYVGAHILWYYVALDLFQNKKWLHDTVLAVAVVGVVIAAVGLTEYIVIAGWWGIASHRVKSVLLNPNILGAFLSLASGFTLYHLSNVRSTVARRGWFIALMIMVVVITLTRSRGAWLNLASLISAIVIISLITGNTRRLWQRQQLLQWGGFAGVGGLLLLIVLTNRTTTNLARVVTWQAALQMIADRPLQGIGPGMYGRMFLAYRDPELTNQLFSHAHNLALTITAEMGIIVALLLLIGIIIWGREVWNRLQNTPLGLDRWRHTVALASLIGFLAHSQVDSFFHYPMFAFMIMPFVARLSVGNKGEHRSRLALVFPALTLLIAAAIVIQTTPAYALYHQARTASLQRDWDKTSDYLNQAIIADPDFLFYRRQLAIVQGVSAMDHHPVRADDYLNFANVLNFNDSFAPDHAYLACLEFLSGDLPGAIAEMEKAHYLNPGNSRYAFNLGMYYEAAGQIDRAEEQYKRVTRKADPSVLASNYWRDTPERQAMWPNIIEAVLSTTLEDDHAKRGDILANAGEWEAAQAHYSLQIQTDDPSPGWIGLASLALVEHDVDNAFKNVKKALSLEPGNTQAQLVRARVYLAAGEAIDAATDLKTVNDREPTPEAMFYWAEAARMQGDLAMAEQRYLDTIRLGLLRRYSRDVEGYANLIGRRPRLAVEVEDLNCLVWPYVPEAVSLPAARLASIYQDRGDAKAVQSLQQMLPYPMRWWQQ